MAESAPNTALYRLRRKRGLSQAGLASLAGCSQAQVDRLEKGLRQMDKEWAVKFGPHLGCHWADLMDSIPEIERRAIKLAERIHALDEKDAAALQRFVEAMEGRKAG